MGNFMKHAPFILTIDNLCNQEWSLMTNTDSGKYCLQCSKVVVDFTKLTDVEITEIVMRSGEKLCGRLNKQQLNRILENFQPGNNSKIFKILAGLIFLGIPAYSSSKAQNWIKTETVSNVDTENFESQIVGKREALTDSLKNVIQGIVIDVQSNEPLPGAVVIIGGTKIGVATDDEGKFKFTIPDSLLSNLIHLEVQFIGFETLNIYINKIDLPLTKDIFLIPLENVLIGEIVIVKKTRWWQFWKQKRKSCP